MTLRLALPSGPLLFACALSFSALTCNAPAPDRQLPTGEHDGVLAIPSTHQVAPFRARWPNLTESKRFSRLRLGQAWEGRSAAERRALPRTFIMISSGSVISDDAQNAGRSIRDSDILWRANVRIAFAEPHRNIFRFEPVNPSGPVQWLDARYDNELGRIPRLRAFFGRYQ